MKTAPASDPLAPYLGRLKAEKIKVTPNRRKVLEHFLKSEKPWTLRSLHQEISRVDNGDLSSIYRALEAFSSAGLLEEFRLPGDKQTYYSLVKIEITHRVRSAASADHHHHHIVCSDCGKVSHLDLCVPIAWMGKVESTSGFRITEHNLEFKGICSDCR